MATTSSISWCRFFVRRVGDRTGFACVHHHHGVGRLQEEERRLAASEAHLLGVLFVVAAHAINAVDREAIGTPVTGTETTAGALTT
jgi:hypothetical protein